MMRITMAIDGDGQGEEPSLRSDEKRGQWGNATTRAWETWLGLPMAIHAET